MLVNCTALVTSQAKPFRYVLTDPRQFDILQPGPGWRGLNAIRSIETARVHVAARERGRVAARGARAAAGNAGGGVPPPGIGSCGWGSVARIPPRLKGGRLCRWRERSDRILLGR